MTQTASMKQLILWIWLYVLRVPVKLSSRSQGFLVPNPECLDVLAVSVKVASRIFKDLNVLCILQPHIITIIHLYNIILYSLIALQPDSLIALYTGTLKPELQGRRHEALAVEIRPLSGLPVCAMTKLTWSNLGHKLSQPITTLPKMVSMGSKRVADPYPVHTSKSTIFTTKKRSVWDIDFGSILDRFWIHFGSPNRPFGHPDRSWTPTLFENLDLHEIIQKPILKKQLK